MSAPDDPVEAYLDRLLLSLRGSPRRVRHTLAEVEAHLLDAVAAGRAAGLDETSARADAVRRMGPVAGVAGPMPRLPWTPAVRRRAVLATLRVGGVGGCAIGLGGVFAWVVRSLWGAHAIATAFPVGSYSRADCARWLAGYPHSPDCVSAMVADHANDFLQNAGAAGVLGVCALVLAARLGRRWAGRESATALAAWAEPVVGAVLAGLAFVVLLGQGLDAVVVTRGNGAGASLSLAAAALLAAGWQARRARRLIGAEAAGQPEAARIPQ